MNALRPVLPCLLLILSVRAALGGEMRVYGRGELPDPREVAAILARSPCAAGAAAPRVPAGVEKRTDSTF